MYRSMTRWTTTVAAAALMALPLAASAQQTTPQQQQPQQPQQPHQPPQPQQPQQPPQQQTPPAQPSQAPAQPQQETPPQTARPSRTAPTPASGQLDAAAAKTHLSAARDTLSQLTSMPEAAKLQGEARTQVSGMIANFNELITTQSEWRAVYGKLDANLTALLGPHSDDQAASGVAGAVGTAGTAGVAGPTGIQLDPPVRAKLVEFRKHLKEFEKSAGGQAPAEARAEPASNNSPAAAVATGTSGMTPPPAMATQMKPAEPAGHSEADKHLDAISAILGKSKTGALTRAQTTELKKHVAELRTLLKQGQ